MTNCSICGRALDDPKDPLLSADCGGDCRLCMAITGEDPGEAKSIIKGLCVQRDEMRELLDGARNWVQDPALRARITAVCPPKPRPKED